MPDAAYRYAFRTGPRSIMHGALEIKAIFDLSTASLCRVTSKKLLEKSALSAQLPRYRQRLRIQFRNKENDRKFSEKKTFAFRCDLTLEIDERVTVVMHKFNRDIEQRFSVGWGSLLARSLSLPPTLYGQTLTAHQKTSVGSKWPC